MNLNSEEILIRLRVALKPWIVHLLVKPMKGFIFVSENGFDTYEKSQFLLNSV